MFAVLCQFVLLGPGDQGGEGGGVGEDKEQVGTEEEGGEGFEAGEKEALGEGCLRIYGEGG